MPESYWDYLEREEVAESRDDRQYEEQLDRRDLSKRSRQKKGERKMMATRKKGKHRKPVSKAIPFAKGVMRDKADRLWSRAVRDDWAGKCAVCGSAKCEAHHLIPRQHESLRYDLTLKNGIALCSWHHVRDPNVAPHVTAGGWLLWLYDNHPERHAWYIELIDNGSYKTFDGTTNATYFVGVIRGLKQYVEPEDYERILGVKFSRWLEEHK